MHSNVPCLQDTSGDTQSEFGKALLCLTLRQEVNCHVLSLYGCPHSKPVSPVQDSCCLSVSIFVCSDKLWTDCSLLVLWHTCYKEINSQLRKMTNLCLLCYLCGIGCENYSVASVSEIIQPVNHIYSLCDRISSNLCRQEINMPSRKHTHTFCVMACLFGYFGF